MDNQFHLSPEQEFRMECFDRLDPVTLTPLDWKKLMDELHLRFNQLGKAHRRYQCSRVRIKNMIYVPYRVRDELRSAYRRGERGDRLWELTRLFLFMIYVGEGEKAQANQ